MLQVEKDCSLSYEDWEFYNIYSSEHNKESLEFLKYGMCLPEFLTHKEFVDVRSAFEQEYRDEAEKEQKAKQRR